MSKNADYEDAPPTLCFECGEVEGVRECEGDWLCEWCCERFYTPDELQAMEEADDRKRAEAKQRYARDAWDCDVTR